MERLPLRAEFQSSMLQSWGQNDNHLLGGSSKLINNIINFTGDTAHAGEGCDILALALDHAPQESWSCLHGQLLM